MTREEARALVGAGMMPSAEYVRRYSLSHARLLALLHYDRKTGIFTWTSDCGRAWVSGSRAGTINTQGYRAIQIEGTVYLAARLAVFYITEQWPLETVDHRNRVRDDDRWENLREATYSENNVNKGGVSAQSGFKGVFESRDKWESRIQMNGLVHRLGRFDTKEEASQAYQKAKAGVHGAFGCEV